MQDDVNPHNLRMFEGTVSLDLVQIIMIINHLGCLIGH